MHIADGVLSTPVIVATSVAAAGTIAYGLKKTKEEDIPKIALMSGTFFALSLITVPIGPSSVHPLICGLVGIILGGKSALAFFPALLLQALLFHHGGLTSLGANTFMLFLPAYISHLIYTSMVHSKPMVKGTMIGALSVVMTVIILTLILYFTQPEFASGAASVIKVLVVSHLPLVVVEGILTGAAANFLSHSQPNWIESNQ